MKMWSHLGVSFRSTSNRLEQRCRKAFHDRAEGDNEFWTNLDSAHPNCECEVVSVCKWSPRPVTNSERIISVVTNKNYVSNSGLIEPSMIDARIKNGISTDRRDLSSPESILLRAKQLTDSNPNKSYCGSVVFCVGSLRAIAFGTDRVFAVYDTALESNCAHAELAMTNVPKPSATGTKKRKRDRATLRKQLLDACLYGGKVLSEDQIFDQPE